MISPGNASSASSRSRARNITALCTFIVFPVLTCFSFIPLLKCPEQTRANATRSLCFASMFACILKTKAETFLSVGGTILVWLGCGLGFGANSAIPCNNSLTPKLFIALPKNTGVLLPSKYGSFSKTGHKPLAISTCSLSSVTALDGSNSSKRGSSRPLHTRPGSG